MQFGKARLAWTTAMVIVAAVITTLAATGHVLDAVMMALLAVVLIGAYTTRKYARAALLYNRLADGRSRRIDQLVDAEINPLPGRPGDPPGGSSRRSSGHDDS
jgi:hypothetical protein